LQRKAGLESDLSCLTRKLNIFTHIGDAETAFLGALIKTRKSVPAHFDLIREGDEFSAIYILLKGWAAKHRMTPEGERQIINFVLPGSFVCLDAAVLERSDYTLTSLTPAVYGICDVRSIMVMAQQFPALATAVEWADKREESIMMEHMVSLGQRSAHESVAHLFLELYRRLELRGMEEHESYFMPLTQETIGDALGLTAVHVNRMISHLQEEGLIAIDQHSPRHVRILDIDALKQIAGFDGDYLNLTHMPDRTKAALASIKSGHSTKTPAVIREQQPRDRDMKVRDISKKKKDM